MMMRKEGDRKKLTDPSLPRDKLHLEPTVITVRDVFEVGKFLKDDKSSFDY
jgi:hypothetical protein